MTEPCVRAVAMELPSPQATASEVEVLASLAALLGVSFLNEETGTLLRSNCSLNWSSIPWEACDNNGSAASDGDQDSFDVDFSSFPSLSLDRSHNEQFDSSSSPPRETKRDVEAHVSALLSRPILVSNTKDAPIMMHEDDDDGDESMDFVAQRVSDVPCLMLQNFFLSFTTLMNSRLRAYATFLARHGLALLETESTAPDCELEDGVVGVEQKLGTMLEIGRLVSTNAIVTSFRANQEQATCKEAMDETSEVTMPLVMDAAIDISLPRPWGGQSEVVTVSFQTTGTISGIFSNASGNLLLRVVGVDLDMTKLLPCMIDQASSVICRIVEMTNTTFSLSLPPSLDEAQQGVAFNCGGQDRISSAKRKEGPHVVEPDTVIVSPSLSPTMEVDMDCIDELCLDQDDDACIELSPEKCEHLVDAILHEAPESILSPPTTKTTRVVSVEGAQVLPTIS